jgi:carboxyl-terminal processing protease
MLRTLDPHSNFFDPKDFQLLQEDQRGRYSGVGMYVGARASGKIMVIYPFSHSPAFLAGIHPLDQLISVDGKPTTGLTTSQVADLLKGPRGTKVDVIVKRDGRDEPLLLSITRNDIPRASVQNTFQVRPNVGYVRIDSFNENTGREYEEALKKVGEGSLEGLVMDLRGNPGGLLKEGVAVTDRYLKKGQVVVSHRGRASAEKPYVSRRGNTGREYPIVVVVDRNSASAAEIVSGALQDHDRAWVLGENTFGKGLVQSQFPLSADTALLLTTAKYYTPSGRLIQRDYSKISFFDYYNRKDAMVRNPNDVKTTDSGRTVYGGGGITPDEKYEGRKLNAFQILLRQGDATARITAWYFGAKNPTVTLNWKPSEELLTEFHDWLLKNKVEFTEADFTVNRDWMRERLHLDVFLTGLGKDEADKLAIQYDPEVAQALKSMTKAKALSDSATEVLAKRSRK